MGQHLDEENNKEIVKNNKSSNLPLQIEGNQSNIASKSIEKKEITKTNVNGVETTVEKKISDDKKNSKETRTITKLGDTTWYVVNYPIKIFINNVLVGKAPYKGKICLELKRENTLLVFKIPLTKAECRIPPDFEGVIQLSTNRFTGKLSAKML